MVRAKRMSDGPISNFLLDIENFKMYVCCPLSKRSRCTEYVIMDSTIKEFVIKEDNLTDVVEPEPSFFGWSQSQTFGWTPASFLKITNNSSL